MRGTEEERVRPDGVALHPPREMKPATRRFRSPDPFMVIWLTEPYCFEHRGVLNQLMLTLLES
jgi:hypothetical protein